MAAALFCVAMQSRAWPQAIPAAENSGTAAITGRRCKSAPKWALANPRGPFHLINQHESASHQDRRAINQRIALAPNLQNCV
jgi:hypothetical protein